MSIALYLPHRSKSPRHEASSKRRGAAALLFSLGFGTESDDDRHRALVEIAHEGKEMVAYPRRISLHHPFCPLKIRSARVR